MCPGRKRAATRIGFIALGRVEDYDAQVVFRHERTLSAPKADRIELLRHTRVQTGQLFMLYDDPARMIDIAARRSRAKTCAERNARRIRRDAPAVAVSRSRHSMRRIQSAMADKKLVIADGHHRYETALNFRNECRAKAPGSRIRWRLMNSR